MLKPSLPAKKHPSFFFKSKCCHTLTALAVCIHTEYAHIARTVSMGLGFSLSFPRTGTVKLVCYRFLLKRDGTPAAVISHSLFVLPPPRLVSAVNIVIWLLCFPAPSNDSNPLSWLDNWKTPGFLSAVTRSAFLSFKSSIVFFIASSCPPFPFFYSRFETLQLKSNWAWWLTLATR